MQGLKMWVLKLDLETRQVEPRSQMCYVTVSYRADKSRGDTNRYMYAIIHCGYSEGRIMEGPLG